MCSKAGTSDDLISSRSGSAIANPRDSRRNQEQVRPILPDMERLCQPSSVSSAGYSGSGASSLKSSVNAPNITFTVEASHVGTTVLPPSIAHGEQPPGSGHAFEFVFTLVEQFDVGAGDEIGNRS